MKMLLRTVLFILCLGLSPVHAESSVFTYSVEKPIAQIYDKLYKSLEDARLYVVLEPDIGKNLSGFAERWGDEYNRNRLTAIRSMVFCNGWRRRRMHHGPTNQVSNRDPQMLALCPLSLTLIEKDGETTALFARPSVIAAGSPARDIIAELESHVIAAIRNGMN